MNEDMVLTDEITRVKKWYVERKSKSGWLIVDHAADTARYMEEALGAGDFVDPKTKRELLLACLGHDLFEDTEVSKEEIINAWGSEVVELIDGLTNLKGDNDFDDYIKNLAKADEKILLVKFADILSNLNNSLERVEEIDRQWISSFWLPLLARYERELLVRHFSTYLKTAQYFGERIKRGIRELETKV